MAFDRDDDVCSVMMMMTRFIIYILYPIRSLGRSSRFGEGGFKTKKFKKNPRMDPTVREILISGKVGELRKYLLSLKSEDELKRTLYYPKEKETSMLHEAIALRDDATTCSLLLSFGSGEVNRRDGSSWRPQS